MEKRRKFYAFIFVVIAYIVGSVVTKVPVTAGAFISLSTIFTLGNAVEHVGRKISIKTVPEDVV